MQCTDFHRKYKELEAREYQELAAAVRAHGGEYIFIDCNDPEADDKWLDLENKDNIPTIYGAFSYMDENESYYVSRVKLNEYGSPVIYGFRNEFGRPSDEDIIYNIEFGYIHNITIEIPDTEDVHDVRVLPPLEFVPILSMSRDDVEAAGFDPNMTDDDLIMLGNSVSKHLDMDDFWLSLEYACEHVGIKRLNEEENE